MKIVKWTEIVLLTLAFAITSLGGLYAAAADDSAKETVKEAGRDASKNMKKAGRAVKDAACPIVNGKVECALEKGKHKVQNGLGEASDKLDDAK